MNRPRPLSVLLGSLALMASGFAGMGRRLSHVALVPGPRPSPPDASPAPSPGPRNRTRAQRRAARRKKIARGHR